MDWIGPFWRQKPSAITSYQQWGWCYISLNRQGDVAWIEWVS